MNSNSSAQHSVDNPLEIAPDLPQFETLNPSDSINEPVQDPSEHVKRSRGRPKGSRNKDKPVLAPGESVSHLELPVKRPRGRPRKHPEASSIPTPDAPKRPRGRPRKSSITPPLIPKPLQVPKATVPEPTGAAIVETARTQVWENATHGQILLDLVSILPSPDPLSSSHQTSPTPQQIFTSHLQTLATYSSGGSSPYTAIRTFWLSHSQPYFALIENVSPSNTSQGLPPAHTYRFFYWDPFSLVLGGLQCPDCQSSLRNEGRTSSGPTTIHDLQTPFFLIGASYICSSPQCLHKFQSTDTRVLEKLPQSLRAEFPAILLPNDTIVPPKDKGKKRAEGATMWNWSYRGVSHSLWSLVVGCIAQGLSKSQILEVLDRVKKGADFNPTASFDIQDDNMDNSDDEDQLDGDQNMNLFEPSIFNNPSPSQGIAGPSIPSTDKNDPAPQPQDPPTQSHVQHIQATSPPTTQPLMRKASKPTQFIHYEPPIPHITNGVLQLHPTNPPIAPPPPPPTTVSPAATTMSHNNQAQSQSQSQTRPGHFVGQQEPWQAVQTNRVGAGTTFPRNEGFFAQWSTVASSDGKRPNSDASTGGGAAKRAKLDGE